MSDEAVVYGVYDAAHQPFSVKLRDFFIDRQRVPIQEKAYFFHLLATMLDAGLPIVRALQILAKKTKQPRFQRILATMAYDVERGRKMSQSMLKFPDVFSDSEVGVIRSGEAIGNLPKLLLKLGDQSSRLHALALKMRSAMTYPAVVIGALLLSMILVVTLVIPRLATFFAQANLELPWLTRLVLSSGQFIIEFSWLLLLAAIGAFVMISMSMQTESGKRRWQNFLLRFFLTRDITVKFNVAQVVQIMSLLVDGGVSINEAIGIAAGAVKNRFYQDFLREMKLHVEKGETLASQLETAPFLFPETVSAMISVGETTGQFSSIAQKLAEHYEEEVDHSLTQLTTLFEPLIMLFTGLLVALFALALLGPIFSLSSAVSL